MSEESESTVIPKTPEKERNPSESSDTEHDPQFSPIITLPEVEVSTNEEHETEFLKVRAKLYRFDSHTEPPEWKERGTGELKLLRHNENSSFRIVMRRDKTLKVCANHFITPWLELKPSVGCEKAFVYTVLADFADEKPRAECLAVKFGTIDNSNLFKKKFEEAKKILLSDCDLYNGKGDKENSFNTSLQSNGSKDLEETEILEKTNEVTNKLAELDVKTDK